MQKIGEGLTRPAGVVIGRDGRIWASDKGSAVALVRPDGARKMGAAGGVPSGLAMDRKGRILIANFGVKAGEPGPLQQLDVGTGKIDTLVRSADGRVLGASNTPLVAPDGTIYCTHSTWEKSLSAVSAETGPDGMVYRLDANGKVDVVAQQINFASGCCFDERERHLYVIQSLSCNVLRFGRRADGTLDPPKPYGPQLGNVPDGAFTREGRARLTMRERNRIGFGGGCQFDAEGNLWVTLPYANRIIAITPNLSLSVVVNDPEGQIVNRPMALAFGGRDMCDLYIAAAGTGAIVKVRSPVPGIPLAHQR